MQYYIGVNEQMNITVHHESGLREECHLPSNSQRGQKKIITKGHPSGHHLASDLPFHNYNHSYSIFVVARCHVFQFRINYSKDGHIRLLDHCQLTRGEDHFSSVQTSHRHLNRAVLWKQKETSQGLPLFRTLHCIIISPVCRMGKRRV